MLVFAVLALLLAIVQKTPMAFLPENGADFVWGLAAGLWIGTIMSWFAAGRRS
jgi:TctA family transporter